MNSVLLDTSFLITLSDPARANHAVAADYYRECVRRQVRMYLSTIVISEYQVKQAINDLPLRNFVVLPFNVDHAMRCGLIVRQMQRDPVDDRVRVKDDFKLLAQCDCEAITLTTPLDWKNQGMEQGAPFASAHTFFQTGPFRPRNIAAGIENVVFAGSGTQPGVGMPMVLISGRLAAERIVGPVK